MAAKKRKGNYMIFVWIFVGIVAAVGLIIGYNTQIKPLLEMTETVEEKNLELKELEAENLLLRQQIEQNQTITETKEVKSLGLSGVIAWLGFLFCGGVLLYVLLIKPQGDEKNMEQLTKFMRDYILKIENIKLYKRIKYYQGSYKGQKKFSQALIIFCLNPNWNVDNDNFYQEPGKEQLIGYLVNRRDPKNIIETFDQGDKDCEGMIDAVKRTHWGMRGLHYEAHDKPEWEKALETQVGITQESLKMTAEQGKAWRGE